jgi:DNA-binding Lrp family transcriptional regulator
VQQADAVTGPTDLVVQVNAEDARALAELIFRSIQTISGVKETDTRIVVGD